MERRKDGEEEVGRKRSSGTRRMIIGRTIVEELSVHRRVLSRRGDSRDGTEAGIDDP